MSNVKKPGYMGRAVVAWFILNGILLATLAAVAWVLGPYLQAWYITAPLVVGVIVSEWVIMAETVAPVIREWVRQEEYVEKGQKASWER